MKFTHLLLIILLTKGTTKAQNYKIPSTPSLTFLYNSKGDIGNISNTEYLNLFTPEIEIEKPDFRLIKNENGLFAFIDGTGRVYKATNLKNDSITFTRIDSTKFYGNNFNSIKFSYKQNIYSLGGYGFWHKHGQLTYFKEGFEWYIIKLKKEYEWDNYLFNYQFKEGLIYSVLRNKPNQELDVEEKIIPFAVSLNIKDNSLNKLGPISKHIDLQNVTFKIDIPSLKGMLIASESGYLLLNFINNKVYKLTNISKINILESKAGSRLQNTFEYNGSIYYNKYPDEKLFNLKLIMSDFTEEPYSLYDQFRNDTIVSNFMYFLYATILALIILYIYKKYRPSYRKLDIDKKDVENVVKSLISSSNNFNDFETNIIMKIIEKSRNREYCTVNEINELLGIKSKSMEIQKRVRTEFINRMNYKFNENCNINSTLIQRVRSNDDSRFINYEITDENATLYFKYITNNKR